MAFHSSAVRRENGRFIFSEVRKGARAKDLEDALQWLINASIVTPVTQVKEPELPLRAHEDRKTFKLYASDVGVLRRLAELPRLMEEAKARMK